MTIRDSPVQTNLSTQLPLHRADSRQTHRTVIALFQGHPELIEGYKLFIPPEHTIHIPEDPQGVILVTTPTGTMEIARDGTVVNDTHTRTPETQDEEAKLPELVEREEHLLEELRARAVDSEKREEYESFIALFEANLRISPEQRKVRSIRTTPKTLSLSPGQNIA